MHYYKRNIGDYHKKAGRLSMLEHGAYTLLADACYDRERFPTLDDALDWTWARSDEEIAAVKFVLAKFFEFDGLVYKQSRIIEELETYQENSSTNKRIALEREEKRRQQKQGDSTNRTRTVHEPTPNHKPLTINQEPLTNKKHSASALLATLGISNEVAADWISLRKAKKAVITKTSLDGIQREADKAGMSLENALRTCCERGWVGFKAEWMTQGNFLSTADKRKADNLAALDAWANGGNQPIEGESHVIE